MAFTKRKHKEGTWRQYAKMTFRVDAAEKATIEALAEREGLTPGSFIRSRALEKPQTRAVRRPPVETAQLAKLLGMLGALGGSIQLLVEKHGGGGATAAQLEETMAVFREAATAILLTMGKRPALPRQRRYHERRPEGRDPKGRSP